MSRDPIYEDVPRLNVRAGDSQLSNQNNSTILLGRDRDGGVDTGYGKEPKTAAMSLIVGRRGSDPSPVTDAASIYLSQKTDPDKQAGTEGIGKGNERGRSGAIMRADCIRISSRTDIKISVGKAYMTLTSDGRIVLDGEIQLGADAVERLIMGDTFASIYGSHIHPTPTGPSGPTQPLPPSAFSSRTVRVK